MAGPWKKGQSGNPGGRFQSKPFNDALKRALARAEKTGNGHSLNDLAEQLIKMAAQGDLGAIKEVADRLDGRVPQAVTNANTGEALRVVIDRADAGL